MLEIFSALWYMHMILASPIKSQIIGLIVKKKNLLLMHRFWYELFT